MVLEFVSKESIDAQEVIAAHIVRPDELEACLVKLSPAQRKWVQIHGFKASVGETLVLPDEQGNVSLALLGYGSLQDRARFGRYIVAYAADKLPCGIYEMHADFTPEEWDDAALGWLLLGYQFDRYKLRSKTVARLVAPTQVDAHRLEIIANGESLTRDLINTPASDMGPYELQNAAKTLAKSCGAEVSVIVGDELLDQNFPMIHTVGRGADDTRAPRLIDLRWGQTGPKVTLVGKGVCFDTGGLNIKPSGSMGLMKKDMGGAATVLGLAFMIMKLGLDLQLRVLIPAVENSISAVSFRPQDILSSRKGLSVENNNTDAEGRLVLADALTYADEDNPDLVMSMATLTGAARVALGPDLSPFFTDHDHYAQDMIAAGQAVNDPVWRLPFYAPYERMIEPDVADLDNAPKGGMAGAITAALFLRRFVDADFVHFDIYGWQPNTLPARPKGGVGMGARAILQALPSLLKR